MSAGGSICWIGGQQLIALNNKIQSIPLLPSRSVSWSTVSVVGQTTTFQERKWNVPDPCGIDASHYLRGASTAGSSSHIRWFQYWKYHDNIEQVPEGTRMISIGGPLLLRRCPGTDTSQNRTVCSILFDQYRCSLAWDRDEQNRVCECVCKPNISLFLEETHTLIKWAKQIQMDRSGMGWPFIFSKKSYFLSISLCSSYS